MKSQMLPLAALMLAVLPAGAQPAFWTCHLAVPGSYGTQDYFCYMHYDDQAGTIRNVRLEYDVDRAMRRIRAAGLPSFLAERLQWGE